MFFHLSPLSKGSLGGVMLKNSKFTMMVVIASLGIGGLTTTAAVAATSNNYQRLFRNLENNWVITKQDLESGNNTFSKITNRGNTIEFSKTNYSVKNLTPLTGLESVTLQSTNSYLQISTGFNEDSFLYERYLRNDGTNEFNISLKGECYIQISSLNEVLDADDINISYVCSGMTEEIYESNLEYTYDSTTSSYSVKVNSSLDPKKVKSVDIPMYFDDGENGKHSVTAIENEGFYNCTIMEWISIPSSITSIGNRAFFQCLRLNNLYIPDGINRIETRTFYRCNQLSNIRLPETLTSLDEYAFYYAGGLVDIHLPNSINSIGNMCFVNNSNLVNVNCPTSLSTIPTSFLYNASSLRSFTIGTNITKINNTAFRGLTNFTLYYEGSSIEWNQINKDENKMFNGCTNTSVVILGDN